MSTDEINIVNYVWHRVHILLITFMSSQVRSCRDTTEANFDVLHCGDNLTSGVLVVYDIKSTSRSCLALGVLSCGVICLTGTPVTHMALHIDKVV